MYLILGSPRQVQDELRRAQLGCGILQSEFDALSPKPQTLNSKP